MKNCEPTKDKENFNKNANHPLQTWEWGEFRKAWGNEVLRFPFGQITIHKIPLTNYKIGIFEKGPKPTETMLNKLKIVGKRNNLIFIKLEPNVTLGEKQQALDTRKLLEKFGCVKGKRLFTPTTFWIDLTPSEEDIYKSFSSKTRYNIRVAEKHGVKVIETDKDKDFKKYLQLTFDTAKRQGFYAHTEKYHKLMWEYLHQLPIARLLTAKYNNEIITAWIVFVWKNFLYYPYGASSDKYRNVMANNLMMWETIKFGKKLGLTTFDLWGREEGKGFTKFKEGYNPKVVEFIGTWDLVINKPIFFIYRISEKLRWVFLRLKSRIK